VQRLKDLKSRKVEKADLQQNFQDARTEEGEPLHLDYSKVEVLLVLLRVLIRRTPRSKQ
jgi:hypothetical protein